MNTFFYKKNQYILDCDFVNRHTTKSLYKMPCVDKIIISFSISDICDKKIYPAKAFLIFYIIFSYMSFIKTHKSNKNGFNDTLLLEKNCDFQIILNDKNIINQFLFDFLETKMISQKKINGLTSISFSSKETKNFFSSFYNKKDPILKIFSGINFNVNFSLNNFSDIKKINSTLKNITV